MFFTVLSHRNNRSGIFLFNLLQAHPQQPLRPAALAGQARQHVMQEPRHLPRGRDHPAPVRLASRRPTAGEAPHLSHPAKPHYQAPIRVGEADASQADVSVRRQSPAEDKLLGFGPCRGGGQRFEPREIIFYFRCDKAPVQKLRRFSRSFHFCFRLLPTAHLRGNGE